MTVLEQHLATALWYNDIATLTLEHPEFDPACTIPIEQFKALLARTAFKEKLLCQLEKEGSRCNQPHGNGWLALRKDGRKGVIGGDCADKNFNASETFLIERNRMNQEIAIQEILSALSVMLKDRNALAARIKKARDQLSKNRDAVKRLSDSLPMEVITGLRDYNKASGDRARISVDVQYVEIEEIEGKKKERVSWRSREIGTLTGLSIWDGSAIPPIVAALSEADTARMEADLRPDQKLALLKKWRGALDQLQHTEAALERLDRSLADFCQSANLALLCHTVRNHDRQREIVRTLLTRAGENSTPLRVQSVLNDLKEAVRKENGGREFGVP